VSATPPRTRDNPLIFTALAGVVAPAWSYLYYLALDMPSMDMSAMNMRGMEMEAIASIRAWCAIDFSLMFLMWAVMMVGMMVPTAMPVTLIYAAVARKAAGQGSPVAPSFVFIAGYVAAWTPFSLGATVAQWGLDQATLLSPMMVSTSPVLGAALLIGAGVYQLTPYKSACLENCRAPAEFIASHWRPGAPGAFRMGLEHGLYCLGCCWLLMGLLFFGGVMNLLWIAGITLFVLLEKLLPVAFLGGRLAGLAMMLAGGVSLAITLLSRA